MWLTLKAKKIFRAYLLNHQFAKTLTPRDELLEFIRKLHPVETNHNLIRIGSDNDGGYLLPDDLDEIQACFSPGTSNEYSFEKQLSEEYGIKSFMCDGSIEVPSNLSPKLHFEKLWLRAYSDAANLSISLNDWTQNKSVNFSELILQIDIEGGEWEALLATNRATLRKFRIITGEFHNMDLIADRYMKRILIEPVLDRLLQDFYCVHIHPNNIQSAKVFYGDIIIPPLLEMTFIRKDRVTNYSSITRMPHPLDSPCVLEQPDYQLPVIWYK